VGIVDPTPRAEAMWGRPECPDVRRWAAPDGIATETDVSDLLGALVHALKPDFVVETGSYLGHTTEVIGRALLSEGRGKLWTFEVAPDRADHVRAKVATLPVEVWTLDAKSFAGGLVQVDLLFVDSEYNSRIEEIRHFRRWASPRCVVVAHDSVVVPFRKMLDGLAAVEKIVTPWVHLPTPRGLSISRYAP
jgi:predicted O-methyltransferase YrrM